MTKVNKIIQYNLEPEVRRLHNAGLSVYEIADTVSNNHEEEGITISHMSVQRFLTFDKINTLRNEMKEGNSPEMNLRNEFREKMYDLDDETHQALRESKLLYKEAMKLLRKANKSDNISTQLSVLRTVEGTLKQKINTLEQIRRDWNTLVIEGYNRQFNQIDKAKEVNFVEVNNMLIAFINELCPECKKRVVGLIKKSKGE